MPSDWFSRARLLQLVCQPNPLRLLLLPLSRSFHKVVLQEAEHQHKVRARGMHGPTEKSIDELVHFDSPEN